MYVIDTNIYIRGLTDRSFASTFRAFHNSVLPRLRVSAVVLFELLAGARDDEGVREVERIILSPFRGRGRLLVPTDTTWHLAAVTERGLRMKRGYAHSLQQRSFLVDVLLAASCREMGATLITANARDFAIIHTVLGFHYVTSLPAA